MTDQPDSRAYPRFAVKIQASITHGSETVSTLTKDMSRGGICIISPKEIGFGQEIELSLSLILGKNAFSESLELSGRIVWCTPVANAFQVGAVFTCMNQKKVGYLDMFLRFLQQEVLVEHSEPTPYLTDQFDTGDADEP